LIIAMWAVLVRFLVRRHILPECLLALDLSAPRLLYPMLTCQSELLTQKSHFHRPLQGVILQLCVALWTLSFVSYGPMRAWLASLHRRISCSMVLE
jgi:hypothetical protein